MSRLPLLCVVPLCCLLLVTASAAAADPVPAKQEWAPSPVPDRVLLSWKADPATTASVTWRTDTQVGQAVGQIAPASWGPEFVEHATATDATTTRLETDLGPAHLHAVTFTNLTPATAYCYRVGDGANWSEWFQFTTTSDGPEKLQFVYVGDAQNDIKSLWSRVIRKAYEDAPKAAFVLHAGDMINRGDADAEWGEWFHSGGWMFGQVPCLAIPGNHEYYSISPKFKGLTPYWRPRFEFPENGPMGLEETVFYIDVQGVRIIGLNSNEEPKLQAVWLESVLKNNPNRWTIVTHHHPIHSTSKGRDNEHLRHAWQPLYDKYHVDLVLQGHDHSYGRTGPIVYERDFDQAAAVPSTGVVASVPAGNVAPGNIPTGFRGRSPGGTVYVVSVSGPKMYALKKYPPAEMPFERRAADTQLYQVLTIDGDQLLYEARTATGELYDAFKLVKHNEQPNDFLALPVEVPERIKEVE